MNDKPKVKVCGAKLRKKPGQTCKSTALMANGRCRLHGGKTPSGPDSPHFKHGRYAEAFKGQMAERFAKLQQDAQPLDAVADLNVQRAMLEEFIAQANNRKKVRMSDLMNAADMAKDAVKSAAIIAQTRQKQALTLAEFKFLQKGMMILMEEYVPDPDRRRNFIADLIALIPETDGAEESEPAILSAGAEPTS